ncbi:hypothetical protein Vadar_028680 [Vaccinium darrowii]|uniref:Uncharacterized protein n=1 Tax=Vaccinium darrowii TaxID=229202 RepID=A0ACB7Z011_9ERIC|nr:hypothetical protein Vadar_028680 [Vaccinium darrowii]
MPTDQTLNEPVQGHLQDPFNYPPLSTPTNQTPSGPVQGLEQDLHLPPGMTTYQTPVGPVVGFLRDPSNPPVVGPSGRMRRCTSCHRLEVQIKDPTALIKLDDGRYICQDCLPISLMESRQLRPFIRQVHSFFDEYLKFPVNKDIPVFFAQENQRNKYRPEIHEGFTTLGVCLCSFSEDTINIVKRCERRGDEIVAVTKRKEIKELAIFLLHGFPKEVLGTTLAHEMVHAWIWLQGWTFSLKSEVEEGICEAVAYKWIKYTAGDYDYDPSYSEKDVRFIKVVMDHHKRLIKKAEVGSCGAEFWKAKRAIKKYGLEGTEDKDEEIKSSWLDEAIQIYEEAIKVVPSATMFTLYMRFLRDIIGHRSGETQSSGRFSNSDSTVDPISHALMVYERAESLGCITEDLDCQHISFFMELGRLEEARKLAEKLRSGKLADSVDVWVLRLSVEMRCVTNRSVELLKTVFTRMAVSKAERLWILALKFFSNQRHYFDKLVELSVVSLAKDGGSDDGFSLSFAIVNIVLQKDGIKSGRAMYKRFLALPHPGRAIYKSCIDLELNRTSAGDRDGLAGARKSYESGLATDDQDVSLWQSYYSLEIKMGTSETANAVYWHAWKSLKDNVSLLSFPYL